jgi:hypothetical protein
MRSPHILRVANLAARETTTPARRSELAWLEADNPAPAFTPIGEPECMRRDRTDDILGWVSLLLVGLVGYLIGSGGQLP